MENETILNDLQSLPPVAQNIQKYFYEKVRPTTVFPRVLDDAPIEFEIEGRDDSMIDVKNIQVCVNCKIQKRNEVGEKVDLDPDDGCVPYCGFLYLMWSDIQAELQHQSFYKAWDYYDIMTYLQILYSVPSSIKDTQLDNALWMLDVANLHNDIVVEDARDVAAGQFFRQNKALQSRLFEMTGRLMLDCFNVSRPYPEGVSINLRFFPNETRKCILADQVNMRFLIEMHDMYLIVPRIIPKANLLRQMVRIPWVQTSVSRFMFPAGSRNFGPRTILFGEHLPRRCLIVLWTEDQLNGQPNISRLALGHHNVEQVLLTLNGEHLPKYEGWLTDFRAAVSHYGELYEALFTQWSDSGSIDISREDFSGGFTVFPFDLTQKNITSEFYPAKRSGSLELTIRFRADPGQNLCILAILEEERVLTVHKNREWIDTVAVK